ncbi:radical SAM/SPASM domain-containing protein [Humidesulfovibrio sp.]|uniref:radical SAM/SPASM domain-containing protein n=1 Tax=Humidesulfovibrio sp. TaxID=2910988 RepID=UPI00280BFC80|nr:radical SAM protein [Humidesulfovibrio sp.]
MIQTAPLVGEQAASYLEGRLNFDLQTLLTFPKYFLLETFCGCNANCIMCGIDFSKKKRRPMDDALFERIITEIGLYRDHVEKVMLYLDGEPLLDAKLAERIRLTKAQGIKIANIATNASLLDADRAEELIKAGLDEVYITVESLNKDIYESIRRGLKFETVMKNVLGFITLRDRLNPALRVRVQMIQQAANQDEPEAFTAFWKSKLSDIDQIAIQKAHNWASKVKGRNEAEDPFINNVPCIALWGTFVVHVDGTAPLCCMDTDTRVPLGNVAEESIRDIWTGQRLEAIRQKHTSGTRADIPLCDGCTLWREVKRDLPQTPSPAKG